MRIIKYFICIALFAKLILYADLRNSSDRLFISLGSHCEVADKLRDSELRTEAFPFDWIGTDHHEKFIELLDNDFAFFLDELFIFQRPENPTAFDNTYYEMRFRHENPSDPTIALSQYLEELSEKYERRINRFRGLKNYGGKVFFIRSALNSSNPLSIISEKQQQTLKMALYRFFPLLNFTLIIINYAEKYYFEEENTDNVIEFKIRRTHQSIDYTRFLKKISHHHQ